MDPGLGAVGPLALGNCQGESCQPSVLLNLLSKIREEEVNVFLCLGALVASPSPRDEGAVTEALAFP